MSQETNLWPRAAILESGVEPTSSQFGGVGTQMKTGVVTEKAGIDVAKAATVSM